MKHKKVLIVIGVILGAAVLAALVLGTLNALIGNGEWTFGWTTYRYDDTGYEIGSGTVYTDRLTTLDVDWVDGRVEIVVCGDYYPSVSEKSSLELTDASHMRRHLSEDGEILTVKYRKPSSFFGSEENKKKDLIVRIPQRMLTGLEELRVKVKSSEVVIDSLGFLKTDVISTTGNVTLEYHPRMEEVNVESKSGSICVLSKDAPSMTLSYELKKGTAPTLDFFFEEGSGCMVSKDGQTDVHVKSARGALTVKKMS